MKQLLSTTALLLAISNPVLLPAQEKVLTQPEPLTDTAIQEVKQQIIIIARRNTERTSNASSIRRKLDPLISLLVAAAPRRSEAEKLPLVVGAWQELWTDGASQIYVGPAPGSFDLAQIYQVVTPNNYYYNIGRYRRPGMEDLTVFLRGEYSVETSALQVNFTKYVFGVG